MIKLVFMGPPGAGKGTQAAAICQRYGIPAISTGEMFRAELREGTELGVRAAKLINRGLLVDDETVIGMVRHRMSATDCRDGFLLDGFPRTRPQAVALGQITDIDVAIYLDVELDSLVSRITGRRVCPACAASYHVSSHLGCTCDRCGAPLVTRDDDREDVVETRIRAYSAQISGILDYYEELGQLRRVDGNAPIEQTTERIFAVLEGYISSQSR